MFAILCAASPALAQTEKDPVASSLYDRVVAGDTLKCAYYIWPPFIDKDVNTGKMSGIAYDVVEEAARLLSIKVEWTTQVNFDAMFEGYASKRYDMLCAPLIITPARARATDFTDPYMYMTYYLYAKQEDMRFENNISKANAPEIRYASLDGDMGEILGREIFPLTEKFSIGQNASSSDPMMAIIAGKADVTSMEPVAALGFMRANPGKIHRVEGGPLRVMPAALAVPHGEEKFKSMLNVTLRTIVETGFLDRVLKKYPDYDETILRVAPGYALPQKKAGVK
jgi:ABC-type amino acid transport substrate-binding protein